MKATIIKKPGVKVPQTSKKTKKETVKQVLASPYSRYWPLITNDECSTLAEVFDKCLPKMQQDKIQKPHWKVLKEMTKEQRKQFQHSNSAIKKEYAFGVNEVTKSLEKSLLQAVLIASDVSPRLLVKHVLDMCIIKNVAILVVPELRQSLQQRFGVSSVVFGVKKDDNGLLQTLKNIYANYPVPEDHMHYLKTHKQNDVVNKESDAIVVEEVEMKEPDLEITNDKSLYLYRTSKRERVFKPEKSQVKVTNTATPVKQDLGFLSLEGSIEKTAPKLNYKALVVKRLKGNKEREKRKREVIKQ